MQKSRNSQLREYRTLNKQARLGFLFSPDAFEAEPFKFRTQWHIWYDGHNVVSSVLHKGQWREGPPLSLNEMNDVSVLERHSNHLKHRLSGRSPLGIVLHDACDFSTVTVKGSYSGAENFEEAKLVAMDNPSRVIDGTQDPDASYGIVHLNGAKRNVAVRLDASKFEAFETLASLNPDLRIGVYSAPIELIANTGWLLKESAISDASLGIALIVTYENFALLALIDENGLQSIVSMPISDKLVPEVAQRIEVEINRSGMRTAALTFLEYSGREFGDAVDEYFNPPPPPQQMPQAPPVGGVVTSAVIDPPEVEPPLPKWAIGELMHFNRDAWLDAVQKFAGNPNCEVRFEMLPPSELTPKVFGGDKAASRIIAAARTNYNREVRRAAASRLSYSENAAIVGARLLRVGVAAGVVIAAVLGAKSVYETINSPAWKLNRVVAQATAVEAQRLLTLQDAVTAWDEILKPRSQAWAALEFGSLLFPEKTGVILENLEYTCVPGANAGAPQGSPVSLKKTWMLRGYAPPSAIPYLEKINSETASAALEKIATILDEPGLQPAPGSVEVRAERKAAGADPITGRERVEFTVVVSQDLSDDLALPTSAPELPAMNEALKPASIPSTL